MQLPQTGLKSLILLVAFALECVPQAETIAFDEVSSLQIWLTVSSLANKEPNNPRSLLFRQIELNWINAPLDDADDYLALYLDWEPESQSGAVLPVSVHKLNGVHSGKIITDYYFPLMDMGNSSSMLDVGPNSLETLGLGELNRHQLQEECLGYCLAYHSRRRILASNCLRSRPNWMRDLFALIGSRALPTLMIPGTHNSATYLRSLDRSALQMITKYQVNQDDNIFSQLAHGVRYLDLRVGYAKVKQRPERLWIYHDIFRTEVSAAEVFDQVRRFMEQTTHEIVIMDFHRFTVGFQNENSQTQRERHAKLIELIFEHLGAHIIPSYLGLHAPLQEYVSLGKRLLVGYADRAQLVGSAHQDHSQFALYQREQSPASPSQANKQQQERDESSNGNVDDRLDQSHHHLQQQQQPNQQQQDDRHVSSRIYNKLKSLKLISRSFSKRSLADTNINQSNSSSGSSRRSAKLEAASDDGAARAALFFGPVRHLWPNRDTLDGLAEYMNSTTCRRHFGELRSMMVELTPTVFGAISDKYDGNRRLAQLANRPVTDWMRDRWLHCVNIVASDFFLGNDLIALSVRANTMRVLQRDPSAGRQRATCKRFRKLQHLVDQTKIPIQFAYQPVGEGARVPARDELGPQPLPLDSNNLQPASQETITHFSPSGAKIRLRLLSAAALQPMGSSGGSLQTTGLSAVPLAPVQSRERRDSFVEHVSDSLADFVASFKRLFSL